MKIWTDRVMRHPMRTIALVLTVVAVSVLLIVNIVGSRSDSVNISLRLKWINQAQFAGYYMAEMDGLYEDEDLNVSIDPAGPNISPIQMVTSGVNDFGIAGGNELVEARSRGVPVVAIAVILQDTPMSLISLKEDNIVDANDLIGKRVGVTYGNDETVYREYLNANGIDDSQIKEVAALPGSTQLLSGEVDVIMAYSTNVPVQLALGGIETNVINLSDNESRAYGDTLFTTEQMIKDHPGLVRKFVKASMEGWHRATKNKDSATEEVIRINPSLDRDAQRGYLEEMEGFMGNLDSLGISDESTWQQMQEVLYDLGEIDNKTDVKELYANDFL